MILAIKLYCELPFGRMHHNNPEVIKLANTIGRTPSALTFKLVNFASFDPSLQGRGVKGLRNTSKLDKEVWNEFYSDWEDLSFKSAEILAKWEKKSLEKTYGFADDELPKEGKERQQIIKARVNQAFFRNTILASYNNTCCITGLKNANLLIAGHIVPWAEDKKNRLNPRNGLCLNPLHDRAFEFGLITITPEYKVKISKILKKSSDKVVENLFLKYEEQNLILPDRFLPDIAFIKKHNDKFKHQY